MINRKFAIHTLGCKVNTYESDVIAGNMKAAGFLEVPFEEKADIYIINTCTVTNIADRKSRQMLHRAKKLNPEALIIATGCYVDAVEQGKGLPESNVDVWIGNRDKSRLADICLEHMNTEDMKITTGISEASESSAETTHGDACVNPKYDDRYFLTELDGHTRAFVKIEDGCNMFCTYCIIPYVRGRVVSRPVEDTLKEVKGLAERGVSEIVLTGIHLSSMGKQLLETIRGINSIPGIQRIRLGSLEPRLITPETVSVLSEFEKLCHHFHLSLQSGSDRILKAMNRRYSTEEFLEGCRVIRSQWPDAAITTDIIVGFPGETEEDFRETVEFAQKARFYEAHIFKYSRRKGTKADTMSGQLTENVKAQRSVELIEVCEKMSHDFRTSFLGQKIEFLAEESTVYQGKKYITGYTREYVRCMMPETGLKWKPGQLFTGTAGSIIPDRSCGEILLCD